MTKIQISDGSEEVKKSASAKKTTKAAPKKIIVTDAKDIHTSVQKSTTLSRKYVKKPAPAKKEVKPVEIEQKISKPVEAKKTEAVKPAAKVAPVKKASHLSKLAEKRLRAEREQAEKSARAAKLRAEKAAKKAAAQAAARAAKAAREAAKATKGAKKLSKNDRAIKSATAVIAKMSDEPVDKAPKMQREFKKKHHAGRIFLALVCSAGTVAALVAFVHFSIPDLSVRVAAIQTGIDAKYPDFIPRGYSMSNVTSDKEGVVVMAFNGPEGTAFTLSEEKSTWDSTALLNNYVKKNYPSDFVTLREQGITIYVRGEKASWVNGGLLYKIEATGKYLTKEQIRNIATSL